MASPHSILLASCDNCVAADRMFQSGAMTTPALRHVEKRKNRPGWRIRFLHPVIRKHVSTGAGTQDNLEITRISATLQELIQNAYWHEPGKYQEAKSNPILHPRAVAVFFSKLTDSDWTIKANVRVVFRNGPGIAARVIPLQRALQEAEKIRQENIALRAKLAAYEAAGVPVTAYANLTVAQAMQQWTGEDGLDCRSRRERKAVLRRCGFVCASLSAKTLSELSLAQAKLAVANSMKATRGKRPVARSEHERNRRMRDFKRFLRFAHDSFQIDSLRKVIVGLRPASPQTIANAQYKDILPEGELREFLTATDNGRFSTAIEATYWRAVTAVLSLCGLRLSELCALRWEHIRKSDGVVDVVASISIVRVREDDNDKGNDSTRRTVLRPMKCAAHQRPVIPLWPEMFWPIMEALRGCTGNFAHVFPLFTDDQLQDESWLVLEDGKTIAQRLTRKLIRLADDKLLPFGHKLSQRARRSCQSWMERQHGPHLANLMLAHSEDVASSHYRNVWEVLAPLLQKSKESIIAATAPVSASAAGQ